ncbi:MAG: carboxypeptidase regulatory-like domain-containing protein [Verrucomicrobiota bacterium]|nr:carboxypeptidase regulatory-like domain-containing protein [Verrucomicrobiota bacterium]
MIASNTLSGLVGFATVEVQPTGTNEARNFVTVRLLGKGSLQVKVVQFDGSPVPGARVEVAGGNFPRDSAEGFSGADGRVEFQNLFQGAYSVCAELVAGSSRIFGRSGTFVSADETGEVLVRLEPTASLRGVYVLRDGITPVPFAQVAVGSLGFSTTDELGQFEFNGMPLGSHEILSSDPVTGRAARLRLTLSIPNEIRNVLLVEQALGEISGVVLNSGRTGFVPNAPVTLRSVESTQERTVTTGPDGRFRFVNVPAGDFQISATDPVLQFSGNVSGNLSPDISRLEVEVAIQPLADLSIQVWRGSSNVVGTNAIVSLRRGNSMFSADTDSSGRARFSNLEFGNYFVIAVSKIPEENHNGTAFNVSLSTPGQNPTIEATLPGTGDVIGQVLGSDGSTPEANASVLLTLLETPFQGTSMAAVTDSNGRFDFSNVAVGDYSVVAQQGSLSAQANGEIIIGGEQDEISMRLFPSGTVMGRLFRQDGTTPVRNEDVFLSYLPLGTSLGRSSTATDNNGRFTFAGIPLGAVRFSATVDRFGGIIATTNQIISNGQTVDLGNLRLDEDLPVIAGFTPPNGATDVPTTNSIELLFSEALDVASINRGGIFLRSATGRAVPGNITLHSAEDGTLRLLRFTPTNRLQSRVTYSFFVIENERPAVLDLPAIAGPTDLAGRFLPTPFITSFTTADNDPPLLVSQFPANNQEELDPRSVVRLSFNEPIRETGFSFALDGPQGPVAGIANVGFGGLALIFTPATPLNVNSRYQFSVTGVHDIAGNLATSQPFTGVFFTLDTQGPEIASFSIVDNLSPVAGRRVQLETIIHNSASGDSVRFEDDSGMLGIVNFPPYRINVQLPITGSRVYRAVALDRFRNESSPELLEITVVSNLPPAVSLTRTTPPFGSVPSGSTLVLAVAATDDVEVTNLTVIATGAVTFTNRFSNGGSRTISVPIPLEISEGSSIRLEATARDFAGVISSTVVLDIPLLPRPLPELTIFTNQIEIAQFSMTNFFITIRHRDGGLSSLELLGTNFSTLFWTNSLGRNLSFNPAVAETNAVVQLSVDLVGTNHFVIRALATNELFTETSIRVISLADLDRDTIPDRDDPDIDGDNLSNDAEAVAETDPRNDDSDGDTLLDGNEVVAGTDPNNSDTDGDTLPDNLDSNPLVPALRPVIASIAPVETVENSTREFLVTATDGDSNMVELKLSGAFTALWITNNDSRLTLPPTNQVTAPFRLTVTGSATGTVSIVALDQDDQATTNNFTVTVLQDLDRDGVPDRDDSDIDGDSLSNDQELALGTNPADKDTDDDGIEDATDPRPLTKNLRPLVRTSTGSALSFDGVNDFVAAPSSPSMNPAAAITVEAWVFAENITAGEIGIIANWNDITVSERGYLLWIFNGRLELILGPGLSRVTDSTSFPVGRWVHIAGTYDGNVMRLFRDGQLVAENARTGAIGTTSQPLRIGRADAGSNAPDFFPGLIDEVRIWNIGRSEEELQRTMNGPLIGNESGLAAYFRLDEGTGSSADDSSPNNNVATLAAGTTEPVWVPSSTPLDPPLPVISPNALPLTLDVSDPNNDSLMVTISQLPNAGRLFQTTNGTDRGALIDVPGTIVTHPEFKLLYLPPFATNQEVRFSFIANDGFLDSVEGTIRIAVTAVAGSDSDGDGMPDAYEVANRLNPELTDRTEDKDEDGLANFDEFTRGLLAGNPDTDNDGLKDGEEILAGTNPLNQDTDNDGILDGIDPNPLQSDGDIDGDGLADQDDPDMDNDGLTNDAETTAGTDPRRFDTDLDGWPDGLEIEVSTNPLDNNSRPTVFAMGEPTVGLILPSAPPLELSLSAVIVAEPPVSLVLTRSPELDLAQAGITISEPPVHLILPFSPPVELQLSGVIVSEPPIGLVLPASPVLDQTSGSLMVSEPAVGLILPGVPVLTAGTFGPVVSEPVITLFLPGDFDILSGSAVGNPTSAGTGEPEIPNQSFAVTLRRIDLAPTETTRQGSAPGVTGWVVALEWTGNSGMNYQIQASSDLLTWSAANGVIQEIGPGHFRSVSFAQENALFYRILQQP